MAPKSEKRPISCFGYLVFTKFFFVSSVSLTWTGFFLSQKQICQIPHMPELAYWQNCKIWNLDTVLLKKSLCGWMDGLFIQKKNKTERLRQCNNVTIWQLSFLGAKKPSIKSFMISANLWNSMISFSSRTFSLNFNRV